MRNEDVAVSTKDELVKVKARDPSYMDLVSCALNLNPCQDGLVSPHLPQMQMRGCIKMPRQLEQPLATPRDCQKGKPGGNHDF